ncbi:MAG TPA: hypothetical protein VGI10_31105 [Polyangiaceae bacterium]|jgi:hypothetical protein
MYRKLRVCLLPVALTATILLGFERSAHADDATVLAADLDWTGGIGERGVSTGQGGAIRLGYKLDMVLASLTPEVGGGYHWFRGAADASLKQGFLGGRLRFGKILEPGVYAHLGYGVLDEAVPGAGFSGVSADAGVSLDLTLLPVLDLGVHAGYNGILANSEHAAFDSYVLGLQAALVF